MYTIETEVSFDSAHFLSGYQGKCGNIHGHRWTVKAAVCAEQLENEDLQTRGMLMDFKDLKEPLKTFSKRLDHCLIIESGSMKEDTLACLTRDGFRIEQLPFRPTAENLARYFYEELQQMGYPVQYVKVYETPNNCATYQEE